jgi:hypothetical protein
MGRTRDGVIKDGTGKVSLSLRKLGHPLHTEAEALCDNCWRRMGQPIGKTKCMILGEGAIVEHQNEMAFA